MRMIRFLVSIVVNLIASAIGFIVAAVVLDDFRLNGGGFIVAVVVFTVAMALFQPFFLKMALSKARALSGGTALVSTLAALIVADVVSDGVSISGAATWIAAAVIVWIAGLLAVWLVPLLLVKMGIESARARNAG
jgi:Na+/melibiose symporter-like transporter